MSAWVVVGIRPEHALEMGVAVQKRQVWMLSSACCYAADVMAWLAVWQALTVGPTTGTADSVHMAEDVLISS